MEPLSEWIFEILITYEPLPEIQAKKWTCMMNFNSISKFTNTLAHCYMRGDLVHFQKLNFLLSEDVIEFDHMGLMMKFSPEYLI